MKTRLLGNQGLEVSSIGLGCMGMSDYYGHHDDKESFNTLTQSIKSGINFWDTSDIYGPKTNEELLGRYFNKNPAQRNNLVLATKFGIVRDSQGEFIVNGSPKYVKQACEASLKRLGVDHIDLYYQHRMDPNVPIEETVGAMADLVKEGKIKYLGLSEAGVNTLERANAIHPISVLQSEYSLWSRHLESDILPACKRLGIGLVPYSPLGRGFLTGAIKSRDDLDDGDWRLSNPRFSEENFHRNLVLVEQIKELALVKKCTPAQLALAWILYQSDNYVPIPGTRNVKRLVENANAASVILSDVELTQINQIITSGTILGTRYSEAAMSTLDA
jgi:aryl-alcohol dehydrogenase-like predicted oxidoreductase